MGPGSTHSGNGVDSTSAGSGGGAQVDADGTVGQEDVPAPAAIVAASVTGPSTNVAPPVKEDTPGTAERRNYLYKPKRNCMERYFGIRK